MFLKKKQISLIPSSSQQNCSPQRASDLSREIRLLFARSNIVTWPLEQLGSSQELGS